MADNEVAVCSGRLVKGEIFLQITCSTLAHALHEFRIRLCRQEDLSYGRYVSVCRHKPNTLVPNHACHIAVRRTNGESGSPRCHDPQEFRWIANTLLPGHLCDNSQIGHGQRVIEQFLWDVTGG